MRGECKRMDTEWQFQAKITGLVAFVENPNMPRMRAPLVDARTRGAKPHVPCVEFSNEDVVQNSWIPLPPRDTIEGDVESGVGMARWHLDGMDLEFMLTPGVAPVEPFTPIRGAVPAGDRPTPGVDDQDLHWLADLSKIHPQAA